MKKQIIAAFVLGGTLLCLTPSINSEAAWKVDSNGRWYTTSDSKGYAVGWKKIGQYTYYFKTTKYAATGWNVVDGNWYYFDAKCRMVVNTWVDGYYFGADGKMAVGETVTTAEGTFTFAANGSVTRGTLLNGTITTSAPSVDKKSCWVTNAGKIYYYQYDGTLAKGWVTIKDSLYYFDTNTGARVSGKKKINGSYYYFDAKTGQRVKGWVTIKTKKYFFKSNYKAATKGWKKIGDKRYYFSKKGVLQTNAWISAKYYVNANGERVSGFYTIDGNTYYFSITSGKKTTGWITVNGKKYYMNASGVMQKSQWIGSKYVKANGVMAKKCWVGAYYVNASGYKSGKTRSTGLWTSKGKTYYLNTSYEKVKSQWQKVNNKYYYFDASGVMLKSQWCGEYYVGSDGARVVSQMLAIEGNTYLFTADGSRTKGIATYNGATYLFNTSGVMQTGWYNNSVATFYFSPSTGKMLKNESVYINDVYYAFDANGYMLDKDATDSTLELGKKIAAYGQKFIGNPYVYGGTSLTKGADCSGFTQSVFKYFGISIPRTADQQAKGYDGTTAKYATAKVISVNNIQPGDLVFYYSPISHVGIYIGDGKIVHASNSAAYPAGGIKISTYNYATIRAIVRYW